MLLAKRLTIVVALVAVWTCVTAYGAINGWWLSPVAPRGDAQVFWNAAVEMGNKQSRGNIALVLIRNGVVFSEHFEPSVDDVDRESLFPLASMSKWFTAYGVMQLVQAGKIDLDAPVSHSLKRWQLPAGNFANSGVTVRRLLSHTAGLTDGLGFGDYEPGETIPSLEASLRQPRATSGSGTITVGREPGSAWQYSGGGYLVLQMVVEDVSGVGFTEWMQQAVFNPIGMQHSTYRYIGDLSNTARSYDATGKLATSYRYAAAAATGLSASTSDLIKFAQAHIQTERAQGLSPASLASMRQPLGRKWGRTSRVWD